MIIVFGFKGKEKKTNGKNQMCFITKKVIKKFAILFHYFHEPEVNANESTRRDKSQNLAESNIESSICEYLVGVRLCSQGPGGLFLVSLYSKYTNTNIRLPKRRKAHQFASGCERMLPSDSLSISPQKVVPVLMITKMTVVLCRDRTRELVLSCFLVHFAASVGDSPSCSYSRQRLHETVSRTFWRQLL